MTVPSYIHNTHLLKYKSHGSYSCGYTLEFMKDIPQHMYKKVFLKIIPICDDVIKEDVYININKDTSLHISSIKWYENEIKIQKELHEKTIDFPICAKILDVFKLIEYEQICLFFNLLITSKNNIINGDILQEDIQKKPFVKFGIIVMEYLHGISGYTYFNKFLTNERTFGNFFKADTLLQEINKDLIVSRDLFIFVQVFYRIIQMYHLQYIHNDLHLGNIYVCENELCCDTEYKEFNRLSRMFTGRVYILDYGNAFNTEQTSYYIQKMNKKIHVDNDLSNIYSFQDILELLCKKMIRDGVTNNQKLNKSWYIYDWFYNLLYKEGKLNTSIISKLETFVAIFENSVYTNKTPTEISNMCCCF